MHASMDCRAREGDYPQVQSCAESLACAQGEGISALSRRPEGWRL